MSRFLIIVCRSLHLEEGQCPTHCLHSSAQNSVPTRCNFLHQHCVADNSAVVGSTDRLFVSPAHLCRSGYIVRYTGESKDETLSSNQIKNTHFLRDGLKQLPYAFGTKVYSTDFQKFGTVCSAREVSCKSAGMPLLSS